MSATSEHLKLSEFIKTTHSNLRKSAKSLGFEKAWQEHCMNDTNLNKYAQAMHELAVKYWSKNCESSKEIKSRIFWVYNYCTFYFFEKEVLHQRFREEEIAKKLSLQLQTDCCNLVHRKVLKLLDVGSCYNPFKVFDIFDVIPIDIAPATTDVFKCDFINVSVVNHDITIINKDHINELQQHSFDVIIFILFLEYLPCPEERLKCCLKAYELLNCEGLLIIITPDSKHTGANAKLMKSWRYILAGLGFCRIKYEKLAHIHCMAFRKNITKATAVRWTVLQNKGDFFKEMFIPQDFNAEEPDREDTSIVKIVNEDNFLNELPYLGE